MSIKPNGSEKMIAKEKTLMLLAVDENGKYFKLKLVIPIGQMIEDETLVPFVKPQPEASQKPVNIKEKIIVNSKAEKSPMKPEAKIAKAKTQSSVNKIEVVVGKCPECSEDLGKPEKTWIMINPRVDPKTGKVRKMTIGLFHHCGKTIRQVINTEFVIPEPKSAVISDTKAEPKTSKPVNVKETIPTKKKGRPSNIDKAKKKQEELNKKK